MSGGTGETNPFLGKVKTHLDNPSTRNDFLRAVETVLRELQAAAGSATNALGDSASEDLRALLSGIECYVLEKDTLTPAAFVETLQQWQAAADAFGVQGVVSACQTSIPIINAPLFAHLNRQ